jgi:hypothetical protein
MVASNFNFLPKQDQNWIDPKLAGLQITGILHKIEINKIIKS